MREDGQSWKRVRSEEKIKERRSRAEAGSERCKQSSWTEAYNPPGVPLYPPTLCFWPGKSPPILTCSSVMDMISCQVSSISPSSPVGSCGNLFLFGWGGHGGILLCQLIAPASPKHRFPQPVWKEERY